ncbi:hypothetical protein FFT09_02495 [Saccharomonospora piscinae]|uniref:hypothetical protein n=1 Tax=Saccharomonospora piscinae TaxID=687388 RepID=UPI0011064AE7|nr:hypothetical protein [Saccharomonospora piscinae]TLW94762.1 hypothetical protein FFT09_02495 [Saccharomonospora piscinae]
MTLPGPMSCFIKEYLSEIVQLLISNYKITEVEAVELVSTAFEGEDLTSERLELELGHELPAYWAHGIFENYYRPLVLQPQFVILPGGVGCGRVRPAS